MGRFQHIGLVDRAKFPVPHHRGFKTYACNSAHLILIIGHDVITFAFAIRCLAHALFTEIDVAVKFADNDHIDLARNLGAERAGIGKFGKQFCRAKVGKQRQFLAKSQNGLLRPQMPFKVVAVWIAHRPEQYGIGTARQFERRRRQRVAGCLIRRTANRSFVEHQPVNRQRIEHATRLSDNFGTDPVSGQQGDEHMNLPIGRVTLNLFQGLTFIGR